MCHHAFTIATSLKLAISRIKIKMGQCTSKNISSNEVFNQAKKSDRQLRTGLKFKDIEFGGFIGYSVTINDVYTPSGVEQSERPQPTAGRQVEAERSEIVENT